MMIYIAHFKTNKSQTFMWKYDNITERLTTNFCKRHNNLQFSDHKTHLKLLAILSLLECK